MGKQSSDMRRRGQVVLLVTVALIPVVGMVGLVTDIGYMRYVQRSAQKAADAAVLAAIAYYNATNTGSVFTCGAGSLAPSWVCNNPTPYLCPGGLTGASNPVEDACLYAQENGFNPTAGSNSVSPSIAMSTLTRQIPFRQRPVSIMEPGGSRPASCSKYRIFSRLSLGIRAVQ